MTETQLLNEMYNSIAVSLSCAQNVQHDHYGRHSLSSGRPLSCSSPAYAALLSPHLMLSAAPPLILLVKGGTLADEGKETGAGLVSKLR